MSGLTATGRRLIITSQLTTELILCLDKIIVIISVAWRKGQARAMVEQLGLLDLIDLEITSCVYHSLGPHLSSHSRVKYTATAVASENVTDVFTAVSTVSVIKVTFLKVLCRQPAIINKALHIH